MCGSSRPLCPPAIEQCRPAALDGLVLVEAREQRVPGDRRDDRVDPLVDRRRHELDPARVGDAVHADARVARLVEPRLGLLREPVEQRRDVAALVALVVDGDGPAGLAESARVPGQDVEAGVAQRPGADVAGGVRRRAVRVGVARTAPAVGLEDRRRPLAGLQAGGRVEADLELGAVERGDDGVARGRRCGEAEQQRHRQREGPGGVHARHAATGHPPTRRFMGDSGRARPPCGPAADAPCRR